MPERKHPVLRTHSFMDSATAAAHLRVSSGSWARISLLPRKIASREVHCLCTVSSTFRTVSTSPSVACHSITCTHAVSDDVEIHHDSAPRYSCRPSRTMIQSFSAPLHYILGVPDRG